METTKKKILLNQLDKAEKATLSFYDTLRKTNMPVSQFDAITEEIQQVFIYLLRTKDKINGED